MELNVQISIPPELEGALVHARARFRADDQALVRDTVIFALRRLIEGMPLDDKTMLESLEANYSIGRDLRERYARTLAAQERALADAMTLQTALRRVLASEPLTAAAAPAPTTDDTRKA